MDLDLRRGEALGLVGESGSGKTTLARALLGLIAPDPGSVAEFDGQQLGPIAARRPTEQLKALQIVFQNPDSALNRRHTVRRLIGRPLARLAGLSGAHLRERLLDLTRSVRLEERHLPMRPSQLSGGLKQRVAIARAFASGPRIVVCDEPTSALDVSVQAAILNLLVDLQAKEHVTYLFISHDLGLVRYLSDRIAVLYLGRVQELGPAQDVFSGRITPTPRPCCRRCRASTGSTGSGSGCPARSRPRRTRPAAACSTPAARGSWPAGSARAPSRRWPRWPLGTSCAATSRSTN